MSAARAGGKGGPPKYLPTALEEDFRPSEEDMEFAERFRVIAGVIDDCEQTELIALLLSTCRNQWMAVNGMFVDLQEVLGAERLPDLASRAFHHLAGEDPAAAGNLFSESLKLGSALRQKQRCWKLRDQLLDELKAEISSEARDRLERDQLDAWLLRQGHGPSIPGRIRKAQYLRLDLSDSHCPQLLELIERSTAKLIAALRISHRVARVLAITADLAAEAAEREQEPEQLFEFDQSADGEDPEREQDLQADREEKLEGAWASLRKALLDHASGLGFVVEGDDPQGPIVLEAPKGERITLETELSEEAAAGLSQALGPLIARAKAVTDEVRLRVFEAFNPNVSVPPMPAPFVVDLSFDEEKSSEERVRSFAVRTADGRQVTPDQATLAMLRCGMPVSELSTVRKGHISYDPGKEGARKAKQIALAAIGEATRQGAHFLAMPEVFLPRVAVAEVVAAAEAARLGLVAGVEYPERIGGPVNEGLIHVPGWEEPIYQRKQGPSVEEVKHTSFESSGEIYLVRRTALGNLGVILCSDVMELDLLWALASYEHKLDVVIVCARLYTPEIFERIAMADSSRLHALIAVVNSWTPREGDQELPSGKGTLVAQPNSHRPLLDLEDHPLEVDWEGMIERPSIATARLNIADIRSRELERPGAHGYISPPRFARL